MNTTQKPSVQKDNSNVFAPKSGEQKINPVAAPDVKTSDSRSSEHQKIAPSKEVPDGGAPHERKV